MEIGRDDGEWTIQTADRWGRELGVRNQEARLEGFTDFWSPREGRDILGIVGDTCLSARICMLSGISTRGPGAVWEILALI